MQKAARNEKKLPEIPEVS